jgi:electron transfer flavoprotein alpha/beta subunit
LQKSNILNYLDGVEIKMTPDKGRGVFATKPLNRGDLIAVEKAVALSEEHLTKNITYLSNTFTSGP